MDILKAINVEQGLTLVVSQHQLETALAYATRIVGFRQGRIAFDAPPRVSHTDHRSRNLRRRSETMNPEQNTSSHRPGVRSQVAPISGHPRCEPGSWHSLR